jgi:hypothetical protein
MQQRRGAIAPPFPFDPPLVGDFNRAALVVCGGSVDPMVTVMGCWSSGVMG